MGAQNNALQSAPWLRALARVFERAHMELYLVGGAVRNPLMGLPLSDIDACGPATPDEVLALCEGTKLHAYLRAAHFGTVELHITDENGIHQMAEYTTFREDSYRCGHKPNAVRFSTNIAVDALRRDFSVNALYQRVTEDGLEDVLDPTGGLAHMRSGVLHTVTENPDQVLKDDGLRILRAVRFQAELDLKPTDALMKSLRIYAPLLDEIVNERIGAELQKIVMSDLRYPMLKRQASATASGIRTLMEIGAAKTVLGNWVYVEQAVRALERLAVPDHVSPFAARMALLYIKSSDTLNPNMHRLHFAQKETLEAIGLLKALERVLVQHTDMHASKQKPDAWLAVQVGVNKLRFAQAACAAMNNQPAAEQVSTMLTLLDGVPHSLKELAVNGNDLLALLAAHNCAISRMGGLLNTLWRKAVQKEIPNEKGAMLREAEAELL